MIALRFGVNQRRSSFHLADTPLSEKTLCGRRVPQFFDGRADVPSNAKTCETCLRVRAQREMPDVEGVPV